MLFILYSFRFQCESFVFVITIQIVLNCTRSLITAINGKLQLKVIRNLAIIYRSASVAEVIGHFYAWQNLGKGSHFQTLPIQQVQQEIVGSCVLKIVRLHVEHYC
jgi:hypothetical protein